MFLYEIVNYCKYSKNINPVEIQKKVCYLNNLDTLFQINDKSPPKIVTFPDRLVTRANSLIINSSDDECEGLSPFRHVDSETDLTQFE